MPDKYRTLQAYSKADDLWVVLIEEQLLHFSPDGRVVARGRLQVKKKFMSKTGKKKEEVCPGGKSARGNSLKREQGKDISYSH